MIGMLTAVLVVGICLPVVGICLLAMPYAFPKKIGHDLLGWHKVDEVSGFDGASVHGKCKYCGKDCMMDSQGNWF